MYIIKVLQKLVMRRSVLVHTPHPTPSPRQVGNPRGGNNFFEKSLPPGTIFWKNPHPCPHPETNHDFFAEEV